MLKRLLFTCGLLAALPAVGSAAIITQNPGPGANVVTATIGQSLTTPAGGPWDHLPFNLSADVAGTVPTAAGNLFLLTQEYLGTPAGLGGATPGFVASTGTVVGGAWQFAPGVTVQPDTQYWVYATSAIAHAGQGAGAYPGGNVYFLVGDTYQPLPTQDSMFRLSGDLVTPNAVPAPAGLILAAFGLPALGLVRRTRRTATI